MLVLTRHESERVVIHDKGRIIAVIMVIEGSTRLGIEADTTTEIDREEIYERKYPRRLVKQLPMPK